MFETKPISCSVEARKCRCSILFLLSLQDLFLPPKALMLTTLWSRLIGVLAQEMSSLFRDDFVTIIQVSGFYAVSARGRGVGQHAYLCPLTWSHPRSYSSEYSPYLSAKWHCIKWDKYFWSTKYFCLPRFDTITLICYSCRDCSSEMIDINWIHI